jgi:2-polyprenyl-3-methyl-5-hydroxy-6-metoxy-1,4-benzoquinol methylase
MVRAQENITLYGLANRATTYCTDVSSTDNTTATVDQDFDVVLALECIHDMPDPISVLQAMRSMAGGNGTVIVMDERTNTKFSPQEENLLEHCSTEHPVSAVPPTARVDRGVAPRRAR